jgi:hypothetical protein
MTITTARILTVLLIVCVFLAARYLPWVEYFFTRGHVVLLFILVTIVGLAFGLLVPKAFTGYFSPRFETWQELSTLADSSQQDISALKRDVADLKQQIADLKKPPAQSQ